MQLNLQRAHKLIFAVIGVRSNCRGHPYSKPATVIKQSMSAFHVRIVHYVGFQVHHYDSDETNISCKSPSRCWISRSCGSSDTSLACWGTTGFLSSCFLIWTCIQLFLSSVESVSFTWFSVLSLDVKWAKSNTGFPPQVQHLKHFLAFSSNCRNNSEDSARASAMELVKWKGACA